MIINKYTYFTALSTTNTAINNNNNNNNNNIFCMFHCRRRNSLGSRPGEHHTARRAIEYEQILLNNNADSPISQLCKFTDAYVTSTLYVSNTAESYRKTLNYSARVASSHFYFCHKILSFRGIETTCTSHKVSQTFNAIHLPCNCITDTNF